ncbi:MAG: damage-inducible protein DinB [Bacteroidia bacterium]|nr:damage-inducible protein DinB [Bacteroidia bacterium]
MRNTIDLLRHMHWADATVWHCILDTPSAKDDERVLKLCHHIHMVQRAFLKVWSLQDMKLPKIDDFAGLAAVATWAEEYHNMLPLFIATVTEAELERVVDVPWARYMEQRSGRKVVDATLGETMLQVAMHSSYHRGQLNTRLRELGAEPPIVDYIAWVWLGRPSPIWPGQEHGMAI